MMNIPLDICPGERKCWIGLRKVPAANGMMKAFDASAWTDQGSVRMHFPRPQRSKHNCCRFEGTMATPAGSTRRLEPPRCPQRSTAPQNIQLQRKENVMTGKKTHEQQLRIIEKREKTANADEAFDAAADLHRNEQAKEAYRKGSDLKTG